MGCGHDQGALVIDARPVDQVDATFDFCPASGTTATVEVGSGSTHATYSHVHAGATWFVGPAAPSVGGADMSVRLLVTSSSEPVPALTAQCCGGGGDQACCTLDGITVDTNGLGVGAEVGDHPAQLQSFHDATFQLLGTLTISAFIQPFENAPGRIAGSLSASSGGMSVSGTFDNTFCPALLTATI